VIALELYNKTELGASLAVLDASARKIASTAGRRGQRLSLRNLAPAALAPAQRPVADAGTPEPPYFFAVVRAEAGGFDLDHRYLLRVRAEAGSDVDEREPNDDAEHAGALAGGVATGYLPAGDVDVFRFEAAAGAHLTIEVAPPRRLDVVLEMLARPGDRWLRVDTAKRGQPERLETIAIGGPVLVRVAPKKGEGAADEAYRLSVRTGSTTDPAAPPGSPP
jgi:hypothetical protein